MLKNIRSNVENWVVNNRKKFSRHRAVKKITMCSHCHTFFYNNSWHFDKPLNLDVEDGVEIPVKFTECPACLELENISYEREADFVWNR